MNNNSITVVGHVGKYISTKTFEDTGNKVVKFSVAVKELSPNSDGQKTLWINVDAWNGLGARVLETLSKGREVVLTGRLAISTYSKEFNGEVVQMKEPVIKLTSFYLCGSKPKADQDIQLVDSKSTSSGRASA